MIWNSLWVPNLSAVTSQDCRRLLSRKQQIIPWVHCFYTRLLHHMAVFTAILYSVQIHKHLVKTQSNRGNIRLHYQLSSSLVWLLYQEGWCQKQLGEKRLMNMTSKYLWKFKCIYSKIICILQMHAKSLMYLIWCIKHNWKQQSTVKGYFRLI